MGYYSKKGLPDCAGTWCGIFLCGVVLALATLSGCGDSTSADSSDDTGTSASSSGGTSGNSYVSWNNNSNVETSNNFTMTEEPVVDESSIAASLVCNAVSEESLLPPDSGYRMELVNIAGVAEKGPFYTNSKVSLVELDSVQRLADSERIHETCIESQNGAYSFANLNLASPYVRVQASGYYRNELTGGFSNDAVTLNAVTDLTERNTVNVNMLTHLEAPRTLKMVENTGNNQPIRNMKAQALTDILNSFGIALEGSLIADDISLFNANVPEDYRAALLAVSIMMMRNGSGTAMVTYADGIADRIRGNGNWDDWTGRADLADWLMVLDTSGTYERIRENVAAMGLGDVPDFEKYLRKFWTNEYRFPECTAENMAASDTVLHIGLSQSAFFGCNYQDVAKSRTRFICDAGLGRYRVATDIEKDTVGLGADSTKYDGAIRSGIINSNNLYVYEDATGHWRPLVASDTMAFTPVADVYNSLQAGEKVVFVLRHAERSSDTGINAHLTDNGKAQAKALGAQLSGAGIMGFAYSGYTRTKETCENIAAGHGQSNVDVVQLDGLDGEWYVKDATAYSNYSASDGGSLMVYTRFAYRAFYSDAFYDLSERSEEFVKDYILARNSSLQKVNFYISHDLQVLPFAVYASGKKVNLRYFENRNWLNYLTGVAVIIGADGTVRYVPVRGLDSGIMVI